MNDNNPNQNGQVGRYVCLPLLQEQLKRFWAIPVVSVILLVLAGIIPIYSNMGHQDSFLMNSYISHVFNLQNLGIMAVLLILPLAAVFCTMVSFFSNKEMTAFYSFPAKKAAIHMTNAISGLVLCIVPVIVFCLILLVPIEYQEPLSRQTILVRAQHSHGFTAQPDPGFTTFAERNFVPPVFPGEVVTEGGTINTLPAVLVLFARMLGIVMFHYALFWLAFSLSGHSAVSLMLAWAIPVFLLILPVFVNGVVTVYVFGAPHFAAIFSPDTLWFTNPAVFWWEYANSPRIDLFVPAVVGYLVASVVVFVMSCKISGRRKAENTGNSVMFVPVKNLLIFLVSIFFGIVLSLVLASGFAGSPVIFYVCLFGGFVLGYFVAQMIAEKTFAVGSKAKYLLHFGCVFIIGYAVLYATTQFGLGFYVNRVPHDAVGVHFQQHGWGIISADSEIFIQDEQIVAMALAVHENIVSQRGRLRENPWNRPILRPDFDRMGIVYLLPDGRLIRRSYDLSMDVFRDAGLYFLLTQPQVLLFGHGYLDTPESIYSLAISQHQIVDPMQLQQGTFFGVQSEVVELFETTDPEEIAALSLLFREIILERGRHFFEEAMWLSPNVRSVSNPFFREHIFLEAFYEVTVVRHVTDHVSRNWTREEMHVNWFTIESQDMERVLYLLGEWGYLSGYGL